MDSVLHWLSMTRIKATSIWINCILLGIIQFSGCSSAVFTPPRDLPDDRRTIAEPEYREIFLVQDAFEYSVRMQTERIFDISRYIRLLAGRPKQSFNVNAFAEVNDSSWFTNRNASHPLSPEEAARGPNQGSS